MTNTKQSLASEYGSLDTLAQNGTRALNEEYFERGCLLQGEGACKASVRNRPKRKFISQNLSLKLLDVAKERGDFDWIGRYWNTWHCSNILITHEGRAYTKYCKNRWCTICSAIRKAHLINRYKPVIEKWPNVHFLTLTVKAQPNSNLKKWVDGSKKALHQILSTCRKRHSRNTGPKLIGIWALECNYNPVKKTYNPHFHILTADLRTAEIIKVEWLKKWTKKFALPYLQKIKKVRCTDMDLVEVIKYGAKIITDPEIKKGKSRSGVKIYGAALHEINKALSGGRIFGHFGFSLPKGVSEQSSQTWAEIFQVWKYDPTIRDWVNQDTGQILTNFIPSLELEIIVESIDKKRV